MRILVTGIGGFVGSRLARHLLAAGDRVSGTYVDALPGVEGADLFEADLLDRAALERAIRTAAPDAVVHLAGLSHIGDSWDWQKMPDYFRVNVAGTENVVAAAAAAGDPPVVIASSADVYGRVPAAEQPIPESRPVAPQTPYALTKAAAERIALGCSSKGAVICRSFNLVGPGQSPKFALASWASQLAEIQRGERRALDVGDLSTARDFVHVDDGAAAYRLLAAKAERGSVYNLASGEAVPMRDALARLCAVAGVHPEIREGVYPPRPFDIPCLSGDAGRLRALGWEPRRTLDDALTDLWNEFGL
jgi:GDP-4-dehydro-6-deoxy-D-mannose reductase